MKTKEAAFTLVELLSVLLILAVLIAIAAPVISHIMTRAERESCQISVRKIETYYHNYLAVEHLNHSDSLFHSFLIEHIDRQSNKHQYTYVDGEVKCSIHNTNDSEEESPVEEVPWL